MIGLLNKTTRARLELLRFYVSPGHNYVGHHGRSASTHPIIEVPELRCIAGRGIQGDRFFDHRADFKGQITFFADEVYQSLCEQFDVWDRPPSVFRRNVITRGVDLAQWVSIEFEINGVRFFGAEDCRPCYWMDQAFCPGTEAALRGRGGLRARILSDGILTAQSSKQP
jgi:MOSC domain-containing protein YiiM